MGLLSEYHFAKIEKDLIIVAAEMKGSLENPTYKLIQNGLILDTQSMMFGKCTLSGKAVLDIQVKIKEDVLGTSYELFVNGTPTPMAKISKEEAMKMVEERKGAVLNEIEELDKATAKIYPILKPGDWIGLKLSAHRVLLGDPENPELVIGYGYNLPKSFSFLTKKDLETKTLEEVHAEAKKNIEEHHVELERSESLKDPILLASGDDFSAEKILCRPFLAQAQKQLNAEEILVSVPRRRCMMIADRNSSNETLEMFTGLHLMAWRDDKFGNPQIYNGLFLAKDGELQGVIPLDEQELTGG